MNYKGYVARVEYDDEDGIFTGQIAGIRDGVGFHAETVESLRAAFYEAVDDYIETCAHVGKEPQKAYSEQVMFRVAPSPFFHLIRPAGRMFSDEVIKDLSQRRTERFRDLLHLLRGKGWRNEGI